MLRTVGWLPLLKRNAAYQGELKRGLGDEGEEVFWIAGHSQRIELSQLGTTEAGMTQNEETLHL